MFGSADVYEPTCHTVFSNVPSTHFTTAAHPGTLISALAYNAGPAPVSDVLGNGMTWPPKN